MRVGLDPFRRGAAYVLFCVGASLFAAGTPAVLWWYVSQHGSLDEAAAVPVVSLALMASIVLWQLHAFNRTRIDAFGVHQQTLLVARQFAWTQVSAITYSHNVVTFRSRGRERIRLLGSLWADDVAALKEIERLRSEAS